MPLNKICRCWEYRRNQSTLRKHLGGRDKQFQGLRTCPLGMPSGPLGCNCRAVPWGPLGCDPGAATWNPGVKVLGPPPGHRVRPLCHPFWRWPKIWGATFMSTLLEFWAHFLLALRRSRCSCLYKNEFTCFYYIAVKRMRGNVGETSTNAKYVGVSTLGSAHSLS